MAKTRISISVDQSLLDACGRVAPGASRSEVIRAALTLWLGEARLCRLDHETERYYASLTRGERLEDARWAGAAARTLGETWT